MAKKQKRQVSFTSPDATTTGKTTTASIVRPGSEFNPDYTFIKQDLKTMGYMVAGFVGILGYLVIFPSLKLNSQGNLIVPNVCSRTGGCRPGCSGCPDKTDDAASQ